MDNNSVEKPLDFNERCILYLLTRDTIFVDEITEKDVVFFDKPEDLSIIEKYNANKIYYSDPQFVDVVTRNPFLFMNQHHTTRKLLGRAIKKTNFDIKDAIISLISDPFWRGEYRKYYIGHNTGDGKQGSFVFLHELGKKIGIEEEVNNEIAAYVDAYTTFFKEYFESHNVSLQYTRQKESEIEMYAKCLTDKFKKEMMFPLLNGDLIFIDILTHLATDKGRLDLIDYANKYYDTKQS